MPKRKLAFLCLLFIVINTVSLGASCSPIISYDKVEDGVIIHLDNTSGYGTKMLKIQVVADNIFRVLASPDDSFSTQKSLMVTGFSKPIVKWQLKQQERQLIVSTSQINAVVFTANGTVIFTDKRGNRILAEKQDGKTFEAVVADGGPLYALKQVFESSANEGFYGLGQHQNGIMNYRGRQVDLTQNNTEVAIPFLVSSKNYGILWDNYSITKVMDSREFEPLSSLKLFAADGAQGWLTATYCSQKTPSPAATIRPESSINYPYLDAMKDFPEGFKPGDGVVTWEGSIQSSFKGIHTFLLKYAGYTKMWIDGKLIADRWRQSWNPGTASLEVNLTPGTKHGFKIEWIPDGSESYISCKWLKPLTEKESKEFSFKSEAGKTIDYYFVYGKSMDEVIGGYRQITGKATLMPKWAMGLWQSRERYKTQSEILATVSEFRKRKIPLDNIVLDWSYWEQDKWGSQQFDSTRFSDPEGMIKTLHETYNTRFMISVWPKFYKGIENYNYFETSGWLYKRNIANRQRDWIDKGYISTFYDAFNPAARTAFWGLLNKNLFSKGVDAWWLDASEPDIYSNASIEQRKQLMGPTALGSAIQYFNAFPLQNAKGVYEGQRKTNPDQRVFILTRSAYGGLQRYAAATWSGDIASRWEDFKNQVPAGINFSLSGLPYWTSDIGGFAVEKRYENAQGKDLEEWRALNTRWYQFGAFCPLFRVHGQFPFREIYNIAPEGSVEYQSILYYDKLRYALMPYIYSLAGKIYHQNYTMMRGLMMDFGKDTAVKNIGDQFMFGPSILVSPVTDFGVSSKTLYLPAAIGWYDFYTGKYSVGGRHINVEAPLQTIPLFIKEGAIIPFGPAIQFTAEKPADSINLYVYTGKNGSFRLYEDEDLNYNYEKGLFSTIDFNYTEATKELVIEERKGVFPGMLTSRVFNIIWVKKDKPVSYNSENKPDKTVTYTGHKVIVSMK